MMRRARPTLPPAPPGSLAEALSQVPDRRRPFGWRSDSPPIPLVALVQVAIAAMLCGSTSLNAIAQWVRERVADDPDLLTALDLPPGRRLCVATVQRIFKALDVAAFEQAVGRWLAATGVAPTDARAVDACARRGVERPGVPGVDLVSVYAQAAETVIAQLRTEGRGHEVSAAREVLAQVPVAERVLTGAALLTHRARCGPLVEAGGAYRVPVDEHQPTLRAALAAALSPLAARRTGRLGSADGPTLADR
jgi:hypothetical protein